MWISGLLGVAPAASPFPILENLATELGPEGFEVLAINVDEVEAGCPAVSV